MILLGYSAITLHKRKVEVKMCFKSSCSVFKSKDSDFLLTYTLQSIDFKSISRNIYSTYYKNTNSKNTPYEPTSLLRLFVVYKLFFKEQRFFRDEDIHKIPISYLLLCGFFVNENLPSHSTFYYFLKRIGPNTQLYYLNLINTMLIKFQFRFFTCKFTKKFGNFVVFAVDSKPVEADGPIPKGTIHSYNKRLNGKLGFKIHSISIVYPFYFPVVFKFTPGHYADSPVLKELFPIISPLLQELNLQGILSFFTGDAGYDGIENIALISQKSIPCISINPRNSKQSSKSDLLFLSNNRFYCINNFENSLHFDGHDNASHRIMLKCYYHKYCKYASSCSKRFKIKTIPTKFMNDAFIAAKLRLDIPSSDMFKFIYSFRKRLETIHAIWNNAFMLENKFYFHNFKELFRFQMKIISYSFHHFFYVSKSSVVKYFY